MQDDEFKIDNIFSDAFYCLLKHEIDRVMAQREEIMIAFVAKYGCHPDEIEQVEIKYPDGVKTWHIEIRKCKHNILYGTSCITCAREKK